MTGKPDRKTAAVTLCGIQKQYGKLTVLDQFDFELRRGECMALLGQNGTGKTTVLKLILGLTAPARGTIRYNSPDGPEIPAGLWLRDLGFLPESVAFHETLTGREMLRFYAKLKGRTRRECSMLLERVGLDVAADRRIRTYSKGMRQRLGLAQALLGSPSVLLLDEPTTGLDPALRREFYDLIDERRRQGNTTMISSHTLSEVEQRADRIVILNRGRITGDGTLEELRHLTGAPTRIRIRVSPGTTGTLAERIGSRAEFMRVNESVLELSCPDQEKMEILGIITSLNEPALDVEIEPARLEQIYAYFTRPDIEQ